MNKDQITDEACSYIVSEAIDNFAETMFVLNAAAVRAESRELLVRRTMCDAIETLFTDIDSLDASHDASHMT